MLFAQVRGFAHTISQQSLIVYLPLEILIFGFEPQDVIGLGL